MALASEHRPVQPLSRLLSGIATAPALPVSGVALDSRALRPGDVFLAFPGQQCDGRDYLDQARRSGATAALVESGITTSQRDAAAALPVIEVTGLASHAGRIAARFYDAPADQMVAVGITGTNGKTTTSRLLAQLLRQHFGSCGVIGTLGATLGDDVEHAQNTTPDPVSLQRQLASWRDSDVAAAVLEVSSHSLVQHRVAGVGFHTAIFTNLSRDHLDFHGSMDNYAEAKAMLFAVPGLKYAIINRDDPFADVMISALDSKTSLYLYSLSRGEVAVNASAIRFHSGGLEARVHTPWGDGTLHSALAGDFNLSNLLAALTAACIAGMPLQVALDAASRLNSAQGRMQYLPNDRGLQIVVDYAHTPDALAKVLQALRAHTTGSLWVVFGCGGDRDRGKRPEMGRIAAELADRIVITSDNPRSEPAMQIIDDVLAGVSPAAMTNVAVEVDRSSAIGLALVGAEEGDCVLVAGKGHEDYQIIGDDRLDFSDADAVRAELERTS